MSNENLKVLITGGAGQVGWELKRTKPENITVYAFDRSELDILDFEAIQKKILEIKPDWIINAAAYTAVDIAEENTDLAYAINKDGAVNLAKAAKEINAKMVQISTDFVFDGEYSHPYSTEDDPCPINVYGASKLAGENEVSKILMDQVLIIRTAWVYSSHGNNFVKTLLRLMSERDELSIVSDQIGTPTWAKGLAEAIWVAIEKKATGVHHWTDAGVASWYDFAVAIHDEAIEFGLLSSPILISPIPTINYPTPACRPVNSVLDKTKTWDALGITPSHWRSALKEMLKDI